MFFCMLIDIWFFCMIIDILIQLSYNVRRYWRDPIVSGIMPVKLQPIKILTYKLKKASRNSVVLIELITNQQWAGTIGPATHKFVNFLKFPIDGGSVPVRPSLYERSLQREIYRHTQILIVFTNYWVGFSIIFYYLLYQL